MIHSDKGAGRESALLFFALFVAGVAMAAHLGYAGAAASADALTRAGICGDLLAGLDEGRQGLVGSLRWAPLPTLLAMPFARLPVAESGPFAMSIVAAAAYALLAAFLNGWWAGRGLSGRLRLVALLAMYFSPTISRHIITGSSDAVFVALTVMTVCFFIDWWRKEDIRSLAYLSLLLGLGIITRFQFVFVFIAALTAVFLHLLFKRRGESYSEGTLAVFSLPAVYLVALWFMSNWLIMGDAGFFIRGLRAGEMSFAELLTDGCDWSACAAPIGLALVGWTSGRLFAGRRLASGVPVAAMGLLFFLAPVPPVETEIDRIHQVVIQLENVDSRDSVAVSGYSGYVMRRVASPRVNEITVHTLSVYIEQTLERTRGRRLYMLVPPPTPEYRWEDMILKYPDLYHARPNWVVFERRLPSGDAEWRLFGVARVDDPPSSAGR